MTSAETPEIETRLVSACRTITATRPATKKTCRKSAACRLNTRTSSSAASSTAGGTKTRKSAKRTICLIDARPTEKNSGLRPRMSSSGSASAKHERTVSRAPWTSAVRRRPGSGFGAGKVQRPLALGERLGPNDVEPLSEAALEPVGAVVRVVVRPLARQQAVGHRVVRRNPLDDERARVRTQPVEELRNRHVPPD